MLGFVHRGNGCMSGTVNRGLEIKDSDSANESNNTPKGFLQYFTHLVCRLNESYPFFKLIYPFEFKLTGRNLFVCLFVYNGINEQEWTERGVNS